MPEASSEAVRVTCMALPARPEGSASQPLTGTRYQLCAGVPLSSPKKRDRVAVGHGAVGKVNDQPGIRHAEDLIAAVSVGNEVPLLVGTRVRRQPCRLSDCRFIQRLAAADIQNGNGRCCRDRPSSGGSPRECSRSMAEQLHAVVARRVVAAGSLSFFEGDIVHVPR